MIERNWDGLAAYCQPDNNVLLGFVEGLRNNKLGMQRRAYGLRHEEYFRLKVLTLMLPQIHANNNQLSPFRLHGDPLLLFRETLIYP